MKIEASSFLSYLSDHFNDLQATCIPLWHPLGFVSCVIKDEKKEHTVRVHFWPKGERRAKIPNWPIHTHSYHLSSLVLSGTVKDIQYQMISPGPYVIYTVEYFEGGSEISRTGETTDIKIVVDAERNMGEQYQIATGVFHKTEVPLAKSALTLVALSNFKDQTPLVLGEPQADRYPYHRIAFDQENFWAEVRKVLV